MKQNIVFSLVVPILLILSCAFVNAQNNSQAKVKATYIFNFPKYIAWPDEDKLWDEEKGMYIFKIGVLGNAPDIFDELKAVSKDGYSDGTAVSVLQFYALRSISDVQILYLSPDMQNFVASAYNVAMNNNCLLVTDNCKSKKYTMINFLPSDKEKVKFEINKLGVSNAGLSIDAKILVREGDEIIMQELFEESEKELRDEKEKVKRQKDLLKSQSKEIMKKQQMLAEQKQQILEQQKNIEEQQAAIEEQNEKLEEQKQALNQLLEEVKKQQERLDEKNKTLKEREDEIAGMEKKIENHKEEIDEQTEILDDVKREIKSQQARIDVQKSILSMQNSKIAKQKGIIIIVLAFLALIIVLAFVIFRGYKIKKQANKALELKNRQINKQKEEISERNKEIMAQNVAISQQKEEIQAQAEQLEETNHELEKLSIVASKTNNAVLIMDKKGNFKWVNEGFTRIFGYTYDELVNNVSKNIIGPNTSMEIRNLINHCITSKQPVTYNMQVKTKSGKQRWIQSTVTPVLDEDDEIKVLVAIDSDISKLKKAEEQILIQKNTVEFQNRQIKASIDYAKTIQQAILPSDEQIAAYFRFFTLYRPKDIVSGDFYWFANISDSATERFMVAAIDCTGHGVPGAFMSMIGSRLLNELVIKKQEYDPAAILLTLDSEIKSALRQEQTDNKDGMDVCLCLLEPASKNITENTRTKVTFCGAKRPLFYYSFSEDKMITVKGTRRSIGGFRDRRGFPFQNHELILEKGDMIYLTSDGLIDQNGPDRHRFGKKRFAKIINENGYKSPEEQKIAFEEALDNHQKGEEQRDDITLLGIRI